MEGTIASIPVNQNQAVNFLFSVDHFAQQPVNTKIRLVWYASKKTHAVPPDLTVGDRWQLVVRLKPPHNLANPGSFDSEKFLFAHHLRATGYVVSKQPYRLMARQPTSHWIDRWRQKILVQLQQHLANKPYAAFIYALTIGEKFAISGQQWRVFQHTGTSHLMAIAGLHIGFVAGLTFLCLKFIWCRVPRAPLWIPASKVAAVGSLGSACLYGALAGFDLPTQRAVIMLSVFLLGRLSCRYIPVWHSIALAMLWILITDPVSILTVGFWLSFGAVALLVYGLSGRFDTRTFWWQHGRAQWVLSVGLMPLTLLFFANASLISPVANSIAIPWVGFVTVPLSLLGGLLSLTFPALAHYVLIAAEWTLHGIWQVLACLAEQPGFAWQHISRPLWAIFPAVIGFLVLLMPRGMPHRWLGGFFLAPMLWSAPLQPAAPQAIWFTLLDVGQGLSAVVQTQHHVLVFDTGAKFNDSYDMGSAVVLPFLRYRGINKIDKLVISHGDNDHMGGLNALLPAVFITEVITSVPKRLWPLRATTCLRGQHWQWDGVSFQFLYPSTTTLGLGNNSSCVLKISTNQQQILLTGDIESRAERTLLKHPAELNSTVIVVPHHGSKTSSTLRFVAAVNARTVLFPVGYQNRFGFPKPLIVARYHALGAYIYDTANDGAIFLQVDPMGSLTLHRYADSAKFIWNQ